MSARSIGAAVAALFSLSVATSACAADVVRIGVLTDMSGVLSDTLGAGSVEGAKLAVEDFGGTVIGKKIEVLQADHQNKADIGANVARKWIEADGVGLILDLANSAVAIAVQNIVKDKNRISIATGAASSELTNKYCTPNSFHWGYDSYQFAKASTAELVKAGGTTWYFISADYAFGHGLENDTRRAVEAAGGKVLGAVRHPINTQDFSSFLLQAQASKAKVIGISSAVGDLQAALKQGTEYKIFNDQQKASAMAMLLVDVHSVGLKAAQGTTLSSIFYWDADEGSRTFAKRFAAKMGRPPTEAQAMSYSGALHYLKAIQAAKTDDPAAVIAQMRAMPVNDAFTKGARIREDGRLMRNAWLAKVKKPEDSKQPWDYLQILGPIAAEDAFRPIAESECYLVKKK
jgi:branched-chain amino acid transport system substrate-binding protein